MRTNYFKLLLGDTAGFVSKDRVLIAGFEIPNLEFLEAVVLLGKFFIFIVCLFNITTSKLIKMYYIN